MKPVIIGNATLYLGDCLAWDDRANWEKVKGCEDPVGGFILNVIGGIGGPFVLFMLYSFHNDTALQNISKPGNPFRRVNRG